jgi:hypothetical protein
MQKTVVLTPNPTTVIVVRADGRFAIITRTRA